jgi:hypothetical protein
MDNNRAREPLGFEDWVRKLVGNLCEHFDLAGWSVQVKFPEESKDSPYAENSINGTYLGSTLSVYPIAKRDFENGDIDRLVLALVHEVIHILVDPFHDSMLPFLSPSTTPAFMETLEQQTQRLTMVFLKTLPKKLIPPR